MENKSIWTSSRGIAACIFIFLVAYMLLMEHRQHVFQFLPYLILLLCPLMHVFMHGGHGKHSGHGEHGSSHENAVDEAYRKGLEEGRRQRD